MQKADIINLDHPLIFPLSVEICESLFRRFLGLMFRKGLDLQSGILLVESNDNRLSSAIHMFFMNFDITVIWINSDSKVVDKKSAKRWFPTYIPSQPARYTLEVHSSRLNEFQVGDKILIKYV